MRSIPQRQGSFPHSSQMTRWLRDLIPMNDQVGTNSAAISQFFPGLLSVSGVFGLCKSFCVWTEQESFKWRVIHLCEKGMLLVFLWVSFFFIFFRGFIKEKVWSHFSLYKFQCVGQDVSEPALVLQALNFQDAVSATSCCLCQKKKTNKKKFRRQTDMLLCCKLCFSSTTAACVEDE